MISRSFLILSALFLLQACNKNETQNRSIEKEVQVIPSPNKVLKRSGNVVLSNSFWVIADVSDSTSADLASYFVEKLNKVEGSSAYITDLYSTRKHDQSVKIQIKDTEETRRAGAYILDITSSQVEITGSTRAGVLNGVHTFLQLLDSGIQADRSYQIKKMVIKDEPLVKYRGTQIENQISEEDLQSLLSQMARLKFNLLVVSEDQEITPEMKKLSEFYGLKISTSKLSSNKSEWLAIDIKDLPDTSILLEQFEGIETILVRLPNYNSANTLLPISEFCWTGKRLENEYTSLNQLD